ncbi:histone-lysine N-methyltransferase SETD5-like isoform X4 [Polyodon spathula]|uniref:histone-lysine N-methyltransferase SETD5-like isoform X4 n=1 Tax=Polyodon spathula TaxID=7913 RepID=UPI001B7F4E71|nr:histone-lysine N-methyltransferase SETD5-like isoform X4 [Polyodon spathula]
MSIVIPLGVTTPDTSYSDMAAGSDPESVEASPAVNEKNNYSNHICGTAQNPGYRGLPYADHNYGAPPPPTPPTSPSTQTIIPRVELNGVRSRYEDNSADSDSSSDENGCRWCHCSLTQDGFVLKCENCRGLDRRKGIGVQRRKQENVSGGESSATESGDEEVTPPAVSYTATQHTPTSITLTVNRVKRSKTKKRKKSTEKTRSAPKAKKVKAFREGSRKSMRMKNSTTEANTLDENTAEGWENRIRLWTDQYEEAFSNQYSADIQNLLELQRITNKDSVGKNATMDTINKTELACNNTVIGSQMQLQLGRVTRVQKHRKILRAARDLMPNTLIIEYRGKVMLKQQFEVNGQFFKKPYPFVLFYSKFNEVEMCVDARTFGNDARFIRRSCAPNAEVRHVIADGMIHLCIYGSTRITKDTEVTIGFDYEFNNCNYKVDCACHKGNQNCPVQKHNLSPMEPLPLHPPPPTPPQVGAMTRRSKARQKELEVGNQDNPSDENSNQQSEDLHDSKEFQRLGAAGSDTEGGDDDRLKLEDNEETENDKNAILNKQSQDDRKAEAIMHVFENLEKKKRRNIQSQERICSTSGAASSPATPTAQEPKLDTTETEDPNLASAVTQTSQNTGVGVSTRRSAQSTELLVVEKPPAKPAPARSSKPRPKSRLSRYRSSSSQRARRQRQAMAQQAAEQGQVAMEEGLSGACGAEPGSAEGGLASGLPLDVDGAAGIASGSLGNRANLRYPKTKTYLVTEWLNDKVAEKPESPIDWPLRITTDPTVLATTLNMLPGLSHSPLICTAPKHYIRFGSPFTPERRRRPVILDGTYGSCKKRWMKQALDEGMSTKTGDSGTESQSSHQSHSCSSTSNPSPCNTELTAPLKKRKSYVPEGNPLELLRPLSPITPPPPLSDTMSPLLAASCALLLGGEEDKHNGYMYSPLHSLAASRCNTPLQFENISSPESSPAHRPESLSPEPCLRTDFDQPQTSCPDLSVLSGMASPVLSATGSSEDFASVQTPLVAGVPFSSTTDAVFSGRSLECQAQAQAQAQAKEQAFRTEFNLIYACSPLNANLLASGNLAEGTGRGSAVGSDRRTSLSEGGFSPGEAIFGRQSQGLLNEPAQGAMSPYGDRQYVYSESGTPPHNPPQKKKVSLLEYRKRKQGTKESFLGEPGKLVGTPTRSSSSCSSNAESPHVTRTTLRHPTSPQSGFSSPVHPSIPQIEEVSPPEPCTSRHFGASTAGSHSKPQDTISSRWMVPTSVERLREGQGVLERVLRGSMKMERVLKRVESTSGETRERDSDFTEGESLEMQSISLSRGSPIHSPQRYSHSPSRYNHQLQPVHSEGHQPEPQTFLQESMSPFRGHGSTYSYSTPSPGHGYRPTTHTMSHGAAQSQLDPSLQPSSYSSPVHYSSSSSSSSSSSLDSSMAPIGGNIGHYGSSQQHSGSSVHLYGGSHLKTNLLSSQSAAVSAACSLTPGNHKTVTDSSVVLPTTNAASVNATSTSQSSRLSQSDLRTLSPVSPGQTVLQSGTRLLAAAAAANSQHYQHRGTALSQYQHPQIQGSGVRTQSETY